jgi:sugar lactone lactonase YvrE
VIGILPRPQEAALTNVAFGGPDLDILYATCGDKVYARKTKAKGALSWRDPIKPPAPRL